MNEQERFWSVEQADAYIDRNHRFDIGSGVRAWKQMLRQAEQVETILECGSNIGRNIALLNEALPNAQKSIIEISRPAFEVVVNGFQLANAFNGSLLESRFEPDSFDLVFTCGVLIHVNPEVLVANMEKLHEYSRRYILIAEYFNRTPVMVEYRGQPNMLFKSDFGRLFLEKFPVNLVDYGFLWGYEYDSAGFDDITWWLFSKRPVELRNRT